MEVPHLLKISLALSLSSCVSLPPSRVQPHVYLGNSANQSLIRNDLDQIKCSSPGFNKFICMIQEDFDAMATEVIWCREKVSTE